MKQEQHSNRFLHQKKDRTVGVTVGYSEARMAQKQISAPKERTVGVTVGYKEAGMALKQISPPKERRDCWGDCGLQ